MQGKNLTDICHTVIHFFKKTSRKLGKETCFVKRKSKLDANLFAEVLVMGNLSNPSISLEQMCELMKRRGVKIKKQGLHKRFNKNATQLMQQMFATALEKFKTKNDAGVDLLKQFSSVNILDSSAVALPKSLKKIYPGYGGDAAEAALKIQLMLNYSQNQIQKTWVTEARKNDQGFREHLKDIQKDGLYLQDLGYFKIDSFKSIQESGAYFISKYLYPTAVFSEEGRPLDLLKELRCAGNKFSRNILLGQKNKLTVRLIVYRLPEEEVKKKIQRIKETARKQGYTPKEATLELAQWSILITNVPQNMLNDEQIYLTYTVRWQVELLFKLCKSEAEIDKVKSEKPDRVLCEIYAKLINIVMLMYICFPIRWKLTQEISLRKAYKHLSRYAIDFLKALESFYRLLQFLKLNIDSMEEFSFKDKRNRRKLPTHLKLMKTTNQEALV